MYIDGFLSEKKNGKTSERLIKEHKTMLRNINKIQLDKNLIRSYKKHKLLLTPVSFF